MDRFDIKTIAIQILFLSFVIAPEIIAAQEPPNSNLVFSAGWRSDDTKPENILQLGIIYNCDGNWCGQVEDFHGKLNLPRVPLHFRHEMKLQTHAQGCTDERLTTVTGSRSQESKARIQKISTGYIMELAGLRYEWTEDQSKTNGYRLQSVSKPSNPSEKLSQPVGFSYWSEDTSDFKYERKSFNAYFDGNIAHKDTLHGPDSEWEISRTSIDFRKFSDSSTNSPVLSLTQAGHPDVLKRMSKPVSAQNSVLPPQESLGRLLYFIHEYGHDFNGNGCFDEFGHNKLMLAAQHSSSVDAFVFIEYTFDKFDGIPMLSVGSYRRNDNR